MPQPGEATSWIMSEPGFLELTPQEKNEAGSFSFVWGMFELGVMHALGKAPSESLGRLTCREYAHSIFIPKANLNAEITYFKNLFFTEVGNPTEAWNNAYFRSADKSEEIKAILLKSQHVFEEDAEALIRIVVRFRNNFFHGLKWAYQLRGQLNNFVHASSVLIKLMPAT